MVSPWFFFFPYGGLGLPHWCLCVVMEVAMAMTGGDELWFCVWFFSSSLFFLYYGLWLPWWLWLVEWWGRWLSIGFCGGFLILFS